MLHDIAPHKYEAAYKTPEMAGDDSVLIYCGGGILCRFHGEETVYPTVKEIADMGIHPHSSVEYLFCIDGRNYFGMAGSSSFEWEGWTYLPKDEIRNIRPVWMAFAGIVGFSLHKWRRENLFCGCCGTKTLPHETERAMRCPACGKISYPQICPAVIVGVTDKEKILLTKYTAQHSSFQKYALIAGYAEAGESLEDTVRREVFEETGLLVKNIHYYKSQPWPFSDALLMGFFCEADGSTAITMDEGELSAAEWFDRSKIPEERSESSISLTGEMIEAFRDGYMSQHESV